MEGPRGGRRKIVIVFVFVFVSLSLSSSLVRIGRNEKTRLGVDLHLVIETVAVPRA